MDWRPVQRIACEIVRWIAGAGDDENHVCSNLSNMDWRTGTNASDKSQKPRMVTFRGSTPLSVDLEPRSARQVLAETSDPPSHPRHAGSTRQMSFPGQCGPWTCICPNLLQWDCCFVFGGTDHDHCPIPCNIGPVLEQPTAECIVFFHIAQP